MALFGRAAASAAAAAAANPPAAAEPPAAADPPAAGDRFAEGDRSGEGKRRRVGSGQPKSASGQASRRSSDGSFAVSTAEHDMQVSRDIEMLDTQIAHFKLKLTDTQKKVRKPNPASPRSFFL